jgi:hypothetical protein
MMAGGGAATIAYQQLLRYREDLENPPLLVVCDCQPYIANHRNIV